MGLIPVRDDEVAAVVTTLEMARRPAARPLPASRLRLTRWAEPTPVAYRVLFARIGTPWLWYSRLALDDRTLAAILADAAVEIFVVTDPAGIEIGLLELDRRPRATGPAGICWIAYLGLIPELTGQGHGRWLMAHALMLGWRRETVAMRVHTCTLDHPRALGFYRAQGFTAIGRAVETFPDPRLTGLLPPDAAPQIPLLAPLSRR